MGLGPGAGWGDGKLRLGVLVAGDATSVAHRREGRTTDLAGVRAPVVRLETQENKGGSGVLTLLRSRGAKEAGGEAASRETVAAPAGSRRRKGAQFGLMGRKKSSGTPGPRANGVDVGRRRGGTEDLFTGGGERWMAGDGAAAGFPGGGACEDGEVRGSNLCGKEGAGCSYLGFYKGRKGESDGQGQLAINGHGGGRLPQGNQGGT
jgi:hypothetical protein